MPSITKSIKLLSTIIAWSLTLFLSHAQDVLPQSVVVDAQNQEVDLRAYTSQGNPKLISLWATWCGPCRMEMNALKEVYPGWKKKYNLEIVTISVDIPQMVSRAKKMFESNGWEYTFMHDKNQELMTKLNLHGIPYSMLIDGTGKILSVQMGYSPGYEKSIEKQLKGL